MVDLANNTLFKMFTTCSIGTVCCSETLRRKLLEGPTLKLQSVGLTVLATMTVQLVTLRKGSEKRLDEFKSHTFFVGACALAGCRFLEFTVTL